MRKTTQKPQKKVKTTPSKTSAAAAAKRDLNKKKKQFIEVLQKKAGNISSACTAVGICRQTYYNWCSEDSSFAEDIKNVEEYLVDFTESKLMQKIAEGDTTCIIFHLKTKGKARGYVEKSEIQTTGAIEVTLPKEMQ